MRIVRAPATALAAKRQADVAILSLRNLFDFFLYFRYRRRLNITQITICQMLIKKLLYYQINWTNLMGAQDYIVHCFSTITGKTDVLQTFSSQENLIAATYTCVSEESRERRSVLVIQI